MRILNVILPRVLVKTKVIEHDGLTYHRNEYSNGTNDWYLIEEHYNTRINDTTGLERLYQQFLSIPKSMEQRGFGCKKGFEGCDQYRNDNVCRCY